MARFLSIFGILLSVFVGGLNWSIVNTGLPSIQVDLGASITDVQWLMNAFGLAMIPFLVLMGRLADLYGRKFIYVLGTAIFVIPSLFGGLATTVFELIAWRAFQGLAVAIILPVSQALMTHEYPREQHGRAIGIWMLNVGLGCGIGPFLGGLLIQYFSWRWLFFINVPFLIISILLMLFFTKETKEENSSHSLDLWGNLTLILCLASLIFAVVEGPDMGWSSPIILSLFALSVILGALFAYIELHTEEPIIEFHFYLNKRFLTASLGAFYTIFFVWGGFFLLPLFLQNIYGLTPEQAGLTLLIVTVPFTVISQLIGRLQERLPFRFFLFAGITSYLIFACIGITLSRETSWPMLALALASFGIGWALLFGPSVSSGITALPHHKAGIAAGSLNTMQEIGGSIGLAILGSILRNVSQNAVFRNIYDSGISLTKDQKYEVMGLTSNPKALANYLKSIGHLPSAQLKASFYTAFEVGLATTMYTLIGLTAVVAVLVILMKPKKETSSSM